MTTEEGMTLDEELAVKTQRINELESALDEALAWAEAVAGHNDFEASDTLQFCLWVLTQGSDGRGLPT